MTHGRAFVDHLDAMLFEMVDMFLRLVARCLDDLDPSLDDRLPVFGIGGGLIAGRMVRFTPKGLSVISFVRAISLARSSGVGWVSAVRNPSPPAFATGATISAYPTHCMPPWTIGCSMPNSFVKRV
tara:strand:- start:22679 stop:23056 length:378 start_codon:yes stop_codon:yes gene_type:complete